MPAWNAPGKLHTRISGWPDLFKETLNKSSPRRKPVSSVLIFLDAGYRIKSGTGFAGMTNIQEVP